MVGRKSGTIFKSFKAESNISNLYLINVPKRMVGLKHPCLQILKKIKVQFQHIGFVSFNPEIFPKYCGTLKATAAFRSAAFSEIFRP